MKISCLIVITLAVLASSSKLSFRIILTYLHDLFILYLHYYKMDEVNDT